MKKIFLCAAISAFSVAYAQEKAVTVKMLDEMTDSVELQKTLADLEKGNEQALRTLAVYYGRHDQDQRKRVVEKSIRLYPLGEYAWTATETAILSEKDSRKRKEMYISARKKFKDRDFSTTSSTLVARCVDEKDVNGALYYIQAVGDAGTVAYAARRINSLDPEKGEQLFKNYVKAHPKIEEKEYNRFLPVYINVLVQNGKVAEAASYAQKIFDVSKGNQEFMNDYASILQFEGNARQTIKILEDATVSGLGSAHVDEVLTKAYNEAGIDAQAALAKVNDKMKAKIKEDVLKTMMDKPAPQFVLKDIRGNDVTLADFKGKTIVIDFWSTWCGPCKAAFPAMQRAVDRYKDDKNVEFLFVHTWQETATPLEDAMKYLKQNNYRFNLYMDYKVPDFKGPVMKASPAITAFGAEGIPVKYVIDGQGNIRFASLGYSYKDEIFVEELSAMIEFAKVAK